MKKSALIGTTAAAVLVLGGLSAGAYAATASWENPPREAAVGSKPAGPLLLEGVAGAREMIDAGVEPQVAWCEAAQAYSLATSTSLRISKIAVKLSSGGAADLSAC